MKKANKKVNILFVENGYGFGGAVVCLASLLRGLDKNKYNAVVIYSEKDEATRRLLQDDNWRSFFIPKYHRDKRVDNLVIKSAKLGPVFKRFILSGVMFIEMFISIPHLIKVMRIIKKNRVGLIAINSCLSASAEVAGAASLFKIPCIAHVRGGLYESAGQRYAIKHITYFIAMSDFIKEELCRFGVDAQKISVVYDGLDIKTCTRKSIDNSDSRIAQYSFGAHNIGIFSCIVWWKGHGTFIKAVDILVKENKLSNCKFFIVGDTDSMNVNFKKSILNMIHELRLDDYIILTGYQANIYPLMAKMDIIVHTSTVPEPFGMVIIEGMALGKTVVAAKSGGPIEVIDDGVDGILITPGNPELLAQTIVGLLRDPEKMKDLGNKARKKVEKKFSAQTNIRSLEKIYDDILNQEDLACS